MLEFVPPATAQATSVGPAALRALHSGMPGRVEAVFDRSFYVRFDKWWVCVGSAGVGLGPLNVVCGAWNVPIPLSKLIHLGENTPGGMLTFGSKLTILTRGAECWSPSRLGRKEPSMLQRGLAAMETVLPSIPAEGLAGLCWSGGTETHLVKAALPPARYLGSLVHQGILGFSLAAIDPERVTPLLGLGPGLTPSGDDYLGGALVALHLVGYGKVARQIWNAVAPFAPLRTNDISIAHLSAAAEGYGGAALHALMNDLIAGGSATTGKSTSALIAIGHTSGWDTLAGAICTLRILNALALAQPKKCFGRVNTLLKKRGLEDLAPAADA